MQSSGAIQPPSVQIKHATAPDQEYGNSRRSPRLFSVVGLALLAVLLVAAGLLAWYEVGHNNRVYNGVSILGTSLAGMTRDEAAAALTASAAGYPSDSITITGDKRNWSFPASALGVGLDIPKTVDAAMSVGRSGGFLYNVGTQLSAFMGGVQATPLLKQDSAAIGRIASQVAADVNKPAVDSKLEKDVSGNVQLTASSNGIAVDQAVLSKSLSAAVQTVPFKPVSVTTVPVAPRVTEAQLQSAKAQALLLTEQPVTLQSGERTWTISSADLRDSLTINPAADGTASAALDNNKLAALLQPVADAVRVDSQDATLKIGNGTVQLADDVPGKSLDVPSAIAAVQQAAQASGDKRVAQLTLLEIQASVRTQDLQALYDKANSLVTQGMRLHFADDGYILRGSSVTGFIDVEPSQGGPGPLELVIDNDVLADRVAGVAYYINRPAADARFRIVNGVPTKVADAVAGVKVDVDQSVQNAKQAIASYTGGDRLQVELVAAVTPPSVTDADLSNINTPDMLAYGQTSYAGSSANRAWNVEFGTAKFDGVLIPPGGTFSTSDTMGDLTIAAGFKMGYGIVADGDGGVTTIPTEAGGICQISTTLFHAVFRSGLHVVERNWHAYWIGIYGVAPTGLQGLDATISPPDKDFRFQNNTGNWIRIKASASNGAVRFELYGVDPHWTVKIGQPVITNIVKTTQDPITEYSDQLPKGSGKVQVEHAQDGFDASISRVVTDSNGNVVDNWTARSSYLPAHNRFLIGTGN